MALPDRSRRRQLFDLLDSLAVLDEMEGRDLLLRDLPAPLCDTIERSSAKLIDLDHIIDACDHWGPANGDRPILILLDNAASLVEGTQTATQLQALRDEWLAAPAGRNAPPDSELPTPLPTGSVTFLFTDIEGSTVRWERYPDAMKAALARHDALLRGAIAAQGGQVFQTAGDSFAAVFVTAAATLQAALTAQRALQAEPWAAPISPLRVRMALYTGNAEVRADGWHAEFTLNRLARLLATGYGDQILLTDVTRDLLRESLPADVSLRDLGEHRLKDLLSPLHVYQVLAPDLPSDFPPLKSLGPPEGDGAAPAAAAAPDLTRDNPYKGLRAFQEADAPDFFGRETLTARLVARLGEEIPLARFLVVVGPSGSGKSSVVRAGLVPALRRGALPHSEHWMVTEVIPGAHPLEEVEAALLRVAGNPPASLLPQLQEDERGLVRAVKRVLPPEDEHELLLVIDQFEEVFTLVAEEPARVHFLASLCAAVNDPRSRMRVVATLRADFYDRPLLYPDPGELVRQRTEVVLPLTPEELYRAITGPARRVGVQLEEELITTILQDVGEQPGTLPLLEYVLTELFERRQDRTMTLAAYRASGGVLGALARRAEEIYTGLSVADQRLARQIFLRLVTLGEGTEDTRRRVHLSELASLATPEPTSNPQPPIPNPSVEPVLEAFGRWRLLTFDWDAQTREPTVEVAHEALLRTWPRLREWLDTSRESLRIQRRMGAEAADWTRAGREAGFLATGTRLAQYDALAGGTDLALTADEQAYLAASIAERAQQATAEQARQAYELELAQRSAAAAQRAATAQRSAANRLRALVGVLILFVLLVGGLAVTAYTEQLAAQRQARIARSAELAAEATGQNTAPELGVLLALEAISTTTRVHEPPLPRALSALHLAVTRSQLRMTLHAHTAGVWSAVYSPDGRTIGTTSSDQTAILWDVAARQPRFVLRGHTDTVNTIAYSPDGQRVVTASNDDTAQVWDATTGQAQATLRGHTDDVNSAAYSPDGQRIVTAGNDTTVKIWDAGTGQLYQTLSGHTDWVSSAAYSPDGRWIVSAAGDALIKIWDATTGQEHLTLQGHTDAVISAQYSPDGREIVSASADGSARIWDATTGREQKALRGHAGSVLRAAYSPDGRFIVTTSDDKTAKIWDAASGIVLYTLYGHTSNIFSAAYSPDGRFIVTASLDGTAKVWDVVPLGERAILRGHTAEIRTVNYSVDGRQLLTASADGTARLWDAATGQQLVTFRGHSDAVRSARFSADGRAVLTASSDHTARIWDSTTGVARATLPAISGHVNVALGSPDGRMVATAGDDATVRLWDAVTGALRFAMPGHTDLVVAAAFSPDSHSLATSSKDKTTRVWDTATGQARFTLRDTDWSWSAAYSPDGRLIAAGSGDGTTRVWDAASGVLRYILRGHTDRVVVTVFSPDGRRLVTASNDSTARIWDTATGQAQVTLNGHTGLINAAAYSPDGATLVTGSDDGTARIWDAASGQELASLPGHSGGVLAVAYSPDGRYVATSGADGTVIQYATQLPDLLAQAALHLTRSLTPGERLTYLDEPLPTVTPELDTPTTTLAQP